VNNGKGSNRRPQFISDEEFALNWSRVFERPECVGQARKLIRQAMGRKPIKKRGKK
jgi:hypothetical protein